ncbi:unnamed protein product [Rotaria sp. Silwood1]|nr:unnamed protein product [Rotaria sp. Silwood1]CAF1312805.1 unnamed protein product [Rotaria sp. Silwood1]CAF3601137.1 unnamed protein product [Rotaria sp. Silwood1]CAF4577350.1 unnamed protein product [Rotaria sp. Silwood1]
MFYVPATDSYLRLPVSYVPVYSTTLDQTLSENSNLKLNNDIYQVKKELAELREELSDLRLEKETCPICSSTVSTKRPIQCDESCTICYPRIRNQERDDNYFRTSSPIHYCSICHDYVIDETYSRISPRPSQRTTKTKKIEEQDKLSEYLSRQLEIQRLRQSYIPEQRPVWIPTAYKQDYPHRRWVTRQLHFSEP